MTKRCLNKTVGRAKFSYDELVKAVIEVEGIINPSPLAYVTTDDFEQTLTPAYLLGGRRLLNLPDGVYFRDIEEEFEVISNRLTKRFVYLNRILNDFWRRLRTECLPELRDVHCHGRKTNDTAPVGVGDVVLVHDDSSPGGTLETCLDQVPCNRKEWSNMGCCSSSSIDWIA